MRQVGSEDEWLAEAYMKTDYSVLTMSHFEKTVREYTSFLLKINKILVIQSDLTKNNAQLSFDTSSWRPFTIETLFGTPISTRGTTTDELVEGDDIPYIAAKKESNGLDLLCSQSENQDFISTGNCIVFIQLGQSNAGYSLYQEYNMTTRPVSSGRRWRICPKAALCAWAKRTMIEIGRASCRERV